MAFDETQVHPEIRATFALMDGAPDALQRYTELNEETRAYQKPLVEMGVLRAPRWVGPDEAPHFERFTLPKIPPEHRDEALFRRWADWGREYDAIYAASPKLQLKNAISNISETVSCMSWPKRWERTIWEWATSPAQGEACPFHRYRARLGEAERLHIADLVRQIDGFLYRSEETEQVVFAPTEMLAAVWRQQEHIAEIERNKLFGFFHDAGRPDRGSICASPPSRKNATLRQRPESENPAGGIVLRCLFRRTR